jgi:tetratricopeptide (TPR) repeat protein
MAANTTGDNMDDLSFSSDNLVVRERMHPVRSRTLFVTFVPWVVAPTLNRSGYGEDYLAQQKIDALHVITARNDWFQHPDIEAMFNRVRALSDRYERVVTYGTSMGAYAALSFARPLGADRAIALMPQYSILSSEMPSETRWRAEASGTSFRYHYMDAPMKAGARAYLIYDPFHSLDRKQAERIAATPGCALVPMPLIGHNWIDPDLLKQMVGMVNEGNDDDLPATIARAYRDKRKRLPSYYLEMTKARPGLPVKRKIDLIWRALALAPDRANLHDELARLLASVGRHDEALYVLRTQATIRKEDAGLQYRLSEAYERMGQRDAWYDTCTKAVELDPRHAYYRHRLAAAYLQRQDADAALVEQLEAVRLAPFNGEYHRQLGIIHSRRGHLDLACASALTGVERSPTSAFGWHCLADVLSKASRIDEALEAAEKALVLEPANAYHHYFLAQLLLKSGTETRRASLLLEEAVRLQPGNATFEALREKVA